MFNWKFYLFLYPELQNKYNIKTEEQAYKHWINFGRHDGKICYHIDYKFFKWKEMTEAVETIEIASRSFNLTKAYGRIPAFIFNIDAIKFNQKKFDLSYLAIFYILNDTHLFLSS